MSPKMSSSHHHLGNYGKSNSIGGVGRPHSAGNRTRHKGKGSPLQKLAAMFKRERSKEDGVVPVRPACFNDDRYSRRSESPDSPSGRRNSSGNKNKLWKGAKEAQGSFPMWRAKVKDLGFLLLLLLLLKEPVAGKVSAKVDPNLTLGTENTRNLLSVRIHWSLLKWWTLLFCEASVLTAMANLHSIGVNFATKVY